MLKYTKITISALRIDLADILSRVQYAKEAFKVFRRGKEAVMIIPCEKFICRDDILEEVARLIEEINNTEILPGPSLKVKMCINRIRSIKDNNEN